MPSFFVDPLVCTVPAETASSQELGDWLQALDGWLRALDSSPFSWKNAIPRFVAGFVVERHVWRLSREKPGQVRNSIQTRAPMVHKRSDQFGKNVLRDTLVQRGEAQTEPEIPPTDAMRFDVWFVPDEVKHRTAPELTGVLGQIVERAAVIELWSDVFDEREFHDSCYKRHAWLRALEARDKRSWEIPILWHICAGKPKTILDVFRFDSVPESSGFYRTPAPGLRACVVVLRELPKARDTILLRLLGSSSVRLQAMRELRELPADAWEKELAFPWLNRLYYDVPDPAALPEGDDKELAMDIRAWQAEYDRNLKVRVEAELRSQIERELTPRIERELTSQIERELTPRIERELEEKLMRERAHLFERKLGRSLTTTERETLAARVHDLGAERVGDLLLDLSAQDLAVWLSQQTPAAE